MLTHQFQQPPRERLLLFLPPGLLSLCGACLPQHAAGAALRHPEGLLEVTRRLPPLSRGHHFFWATSWSMCLSRASSATSRLRRVFSASSSLRRLASSAFMPPYWLRQRWKVCSLTPSFWQTWPMVKPWLRSVSACRSLGMISSAVCRFIVRLLPKGRQRLSYHLDHFLGSTPA